MMIEFDESDPLEVTGVEQQEARRTGGVPTPEELRPGLWSIPVPIPVPSLRFVNCYVFLADDGVVLVDPGWADDDSWDALCAGLAAAGSSPELVSKVVATHWHFDHLGLARRVQSVSGASIALHHLDVRRLAINQAMSRQIPAERRASLDRLGVPEAEVAEMLDGVGNLRGTAPDWVDLVLSDGDLVQNSDWSMRVVWTPGHSPGHVCLYEEASGLLLTGDHVLPRISPNVSINLSDLDTADDPLGDYLASLRKVDEIRPVEVLPAHLWRFRRLDVRVKQLIEHHAARVEEVRALLRPEGVTAWEVATQLTWSRPWSTFNPGAKRAALGETGAHLTALERESAARVELGRHDRWFSRQRSAGA